MFYGISWKEAKQMVESGELQIIGSNLGQINNQGEFTLNREKTKLYKRRHTAAKAHYDLIAQK
jgi:hypothetical protein